MQKNDMIPLLITSCVVSNAPLTVLSDSNARLNSTINALLEISDRCYDVPVVVCDGSGYDFANEKEFLESKFKRIEFLSFHNDSNSVRLYGKGYGEGEIVNYALANSKILNEYDIFAKCTSKLWPSNYIKCIKAFSGNAAFLTAPFFSPDKVDTRFYIIRKQYYISKFSNVHLKVDDLNGRHLEHVFFEVINNLPYREVIGREIPEVYGHSGSVGIHFKPSRLKNFIKKIKARSAIFLNLKV
ncbi:hypothetical protein RN333_07550 [Enterobacter kobei]|uniref:hypothetical protein n=1 Tax=Enterobacter kobei TaxID=208224 RepID=UPI0028D24AE3|nr:hypothetical protein [Enterobacter kobei]WNP36057.1 hypothetical protein RN333_07550 [Enterobacter kobei]